MVLKMIKTGILALVLSCFALIGGAFAGSPNVDGKGVAVQGYDPVAYFTAGKPTKGKADFSAKYDGATYYFASGENKVKFEAEPAKYAPQFGGYCAYGLAQGYKVKIEPEQFTVLNGKLYLNYDASVQKTWLKDTKGYISQANKNWK